MAERLTYFPALSARRKDGSGDSGWLIPNAADSEVQLHLLTGSGHWETTGSQVNDVVSDTAVPNPLTVDVAAPWSDAVWPVPTAVRFVGTGDWAVQQNVPRRSS